MKYLGLGLLIGIAGAALIATAALLSRASTTIPAETHAALPASATASPSASPAPTRLPLATFTQTPSSTLPSPPMEAGGDGPSFTSTPDAVEAAATSGELTFRGPLSSDQQKALYRASLAYVTSNVEESVRLAKEINAVGYGDPSNICGPLAIAILRDADLLSSSTTPHDFWLLNPLASGDRALLKRTFPADRYLYTRSLTPLNKMDWISMPLEPGDFVFIWHGSGGNFDHMLVVSRVDSGLRAYAVTNYERRRGS